MTNLQLLLTICIPSLLVVVSWLSNNVRLSRVEAEIISLRNEQINIRTEHHRDALELLRSMTQIHDRTATVETRLAVVESKQG